MSVKDQSTVLSEWQFSGRAWCRSAGGTYWTGKPARFLDILQQDNVNRTRALERTIRGRHNP